MARTEEQKAQHRKRVAESRARKKAREAAKGVIRYGSWVIPLVGDPIQIGPFKSKHVTLKARYRTVRQLMEKKNARDSDIRLLGMYEKGQLEEDD